MRVRIIAGLLSTLMLLVIMPTAWEDTSGAYVDKFMDGGSQASMEVVFKGTGSAVYDPSVFFEIDKNVPIASASMKIATMNTNVGPWVTDPSLDIGMNEDVQWSYTGEGYGDLGHVRSYSDDTTVKTSNFPSGGTNTVGELIIPQGSTVNKASMEIRGRYQPTIPGPITMSSGGSVSYTLTIVKMGDVDGDGMNDTVMSTGVNGNMYYYKQTSEGTFSATSLIYVGTVADYVLYDVDKDGDLDLVYCQSSGVKYLTNTAGVFSTSSSTLTTTFIPARLAVGDFDNDGEKDMVGATSTFTLGSSGTQVRVFKRSSGTTFDLWPVYDGGSGSGGGNIQFLKVGDWNNDDYLDVYVALTDNKVYTIENPASTTYWGDTTNIGTKTRWTIRNVYTASATISGFDVGDADLDGKADLCVAPSQYYGAIIYVSNEGSGSWKAYTVSQSSYYYPPQSCIFTDLSNDGYLDILYTQGMSDYYYYNKVAWLNSGGNPEKNSWTETALLNQQPTTGYDCFAGDLNSDGYWDAGVCLRTNRQVITFYSVSPYTGKLEAGFIEDGGLSGQRDLEKVDVDKDGDLDMVITAYKSGTVGWLENDGTPWEGNWPFHRLNKAMIAGANEVSVADIDGDGDMDAAVTAYDSGQIFWLENTGDAKKTWTTRVVGSMNQPMGVGVCDFDKDGIAEIVATSGYYWNDGVQMFYTNNPQGLWNKNLMLSSQYCGAIQIVDMNDDGYQDVLACVGGWSGTAMIFRNPCKTASKLSAWPQISAIGGLQYPYEARAFDIDNDGVLDVVAPNQVWSGASIVWGKGPKNKNATSGWSTFSFGSGKVSYPWGIDVCDIDNDKFADVFVTNHYMWGYYTSKGVYWFEEGDDPKKEWEFRTLENTYTENYAVKCMDSDKDGVEEIYSASYGNNRIFLVKPILNYPSNVRIDLGSDGINDWTNPGAGTLKGIISGIDLGTKMQAVVNTVPSKVTRFTDGYGNPMLRVPFSISTGTGGRLTVYSIDMRYDVTFALDNNGAIKRAIYDSIPHYENAVDPRTRVYLLFKGAIDGDAASEVRLKVSDLKVEYNAPPKMVKALPTKLTVKEESIRTGVLDLSKYFTDDYDGPGMLHYEAITTGVYRNKVDVRVENGANVTIDAKTKDFDREVSVKFRVTDNGGPGGIGQRWMETKEILVDVEGVNDNPQLGNMTLPSKVYGMEGEDVMVLDLTGMDLFKDPDDPTGSVIRYTLQLDPAGKYPGDLSGVSVYLRGKEIHVVSAGDSTPKNIVMRLFGSDSDSLQNAASLDTLVDINNTDDGPVWSALPNVTLKEDQSVKAIVDLSGYVSDIDTPMTSLSYSIVSQTGISYGYVRQEDSDRSKLDYESRLPNWYGEVRVVVQVASQNYTEQNGFTIVVEPVNDLPSVEIRYPVEGGRIESGKEISIAGMADDVEGIQKVEVYFEGKWVKAIGQNFWGTTLIVPEVREATVNGIEVRATDTDGVVVYSYVNVTVVPREVEVNPDTDGDGVDDIFDDFDLDPSEWKDSDLDGMGDNSDLWPHVKGWTVDTDGDGYADPADYRAYDANIWEESQVIETPGGEGGKGEGSGGVSIVPILLWLIAVLMVIAAVMSFVAYRGKRKASRDPKMSVAYVKRREARKERLARALGFAHLDRFLTSMQLKDLEAQRMTHPAPAVYQMPNPSMRGPMQAGAIQPMPAHPSLPPHMQGSRPGQTGQIMPMKIKH